MIAISDVESTTVSRERRRVALAAKEELSGEVRQQFGILSKKVDFITNLLHTDLVARVSRLESLVVCGPSLGPTVDEVLSEMLTKQKEELGLPVVPAFPCRARVHPPQKPADLQCSQHKDHEGNNDSELGKSLVLPGSQRMDFEGNDSTQSGKSPGLPGSQRTDFEGDDNNASNISLGSQGFQHTDVGGKDTPKSGMSLGLQGSQHTHFKGGNGNESGKPLGLLGLQHTHVEGAMDEGIVIEGAMNEGAMNESAMNEGGQKDEAMVLSPEHALLLEHFTRMMRRREPGLTYARDMR